MANTLGAYIDRVRSIVDDEVGKDGDRRWSDKELTEYIEDARTRWCEEIGAIEDKVTVSETLATGTFTLTGTMGGISSVTVNDVEILSAAVPFNTSLTQTASDVASNITTYTSSPNYTATSSGAVVTVSAVAGTGATPNRYVIAITGTGDMAAANGAMSGGTSLCRMYLVTDQQVYDVDERIIAIKRARITGQTYPLIKTSIAELDSMFGGWQSAEGVPLQYVFNPRNMTLTFDKLPDDDYTLELEVDRFPLTELDSANLSTDIEIPAKQAPKLDNWILFRAYSKADSDAYNTELALKHKALWDEDVTTINNRQSRAGDSGGMAEAGAAFL